MGTNPTSSGQPRSNRNCIFRKAMHLRHFSLVPCRKPRTGAQGPGARPARPRSCMFQPLLLNRQGVLAKVPDCSPVIHCLGRDTPRGPHYPLRPLWGAHSLGLLTSQLMLQVASRVRALCAQSPPSQGPSRQEVRGQQGYPRALPASGVGPFSMGHSHGHKQPSPLQERSLC